MFYLFLFVFLFIILGCSAYYKKKPNIFLMLFFTAVFLASGLRGDVGQDTMSYHSHYNYITDLDSFFDITKTREPFLYVIIYLYKLFFDSFTGFLLVISFIQSTLLYYATKHIYHRSFFLIFYIIIFFFEFHLNVLRASTALLFFLCSLAYIKSKKNLGLTFLILSILSHISIVILLPVIIARMNISLRNTIYILLACLLLGAITYYVFGDLIYMKIEGYDLLNFSNARLPVVVSFLLLIAWISRFMTTQVPREITIALVIFSVFYLYSGVSDIAYRFYLISLCCLLYLIAENKSMQLTKLRMKQINVGILCILLWISYTNINFVIREREFRINSGSGLVDFTYIPYSFYYESNYR